MYIFIDETGSFQVSSRSHALSCVAALIVPESFARTLFRHFRRLLRSWDSPQTEVKGSKLSEAQMAQVIRAVKRFDILLIAVAIDMGIHSEAGLTAHKRAQIDKILAPASSTMTPAVRAHLDRLAARVDSLPNQLYVQSVLLTTLVQDVLQTSTLYYVQRIPKTLGSFTWRLDAKDATPTGYEKLWQDIVGPILQTRSLSTPLIQITGEDYSAFDRYCGGMTEPPKHLKARLPDKREPFLYVDSSFLLRDMRFSASHRLTGLQIVDMLAAAIRRACNGSLQSDGWTGIGGFLPQPERRKDCVHLLALEDVSNDNLPYSAIIKKWNLEARRVVFERERNGPRHK